MKNTVKTDGNSPIGVINDETTIGQSGLTKRELFASRALQGMYSNHHIVDTFGCGQVMAEEAVKIADALIEALNK